MKCSEILHVYQCQLLIGLVLFTFFATFHHQLKNYGVSMFRASPPQVSHKHNAFEIEMKPFLKWQSDLFADYTLIRASRFML